MLKHFHTAYCVFTLHIILYIQLYFILFYHYIFNSAQCHKSDLQKCIKSHQT